MNQHVQRFIYTVGVITFIFVLFKFVLPFLRQIVGNTIGLSLVIVVVLAIAYVIINLYRKSKKNFNK